MTKEQFNIIKERLAKWREERKLTYENQNAGFLGNVFEEISEYFRSNNDLERIDALCDIVVLCFNSFDMDYDYYVDHSSNTENPRIDGIIDAISFFSYKRIINGRFPNNSIPLTISRCFQLGNSLGFDFYRCILETLKELESRSGYYDPEIKKFVKNKGAYSITCVEREYPGSKYSIAENKKDFIVFNERGETEAFLDKWYKADYSKYYMGD